MRVSSIILNLILVFCFLRCDQEKLDLPSPEIPEEEYLTTPLHFERAIRGIYAGFTSLYAFIERQNFIPHQIRLLPGDDVTHISTFRTDDQHDFESFHEVDSRNRANQFLYENMYKIVNRANIVIEYLEREDLTVYTDDQKLRDAHLGEALFLRAIIFFRVYNYWGSHAIMPLQRIDLSDYLSLEMSGGTALLDQCIMDFQRAGDLLPDKWAESKRGRATSNSAFGFLGKALIFRACYTGNQDDYLQAIVAFDRINNVQLMKDFGANFDPQHENNLESLFEFQASAPPSLMNNSWITNEESQIHGIMGAYWGMFNNIRLFTRYPYMPTTKLINSFDPLDPRFEETFKKDSQIPTGYLFVKYLKRKPTEVVDPQSEWINNPRILRYADVLLMKSEALLKTGQTKQAIQAINQVRGRARNMTYDGLVPADLPDHETNEKIIMQWIKDERFRELCAEENIRWLDL